MTVFYLRKASVLIGKANGSAIDVSNMHFRFSTSIATTETPNVLRLHIWNLSDATVNTLTQQQNGTLEFNQVQVQAGYQDGPYGLIFAGTILYMRKGRESPVDTYLDIDAADGDQAYNFSVVNANVAPGGSQKDAITQINSAMSANGVQPATQPPAVDATTYPRGLSMWGMARDHARRIAANNGLQWSIQQGQQSWLGQGATLPQTVELNAATGMIGIPEQTIQGINVKSLLNPNLQPGVTLKLNNADIKQAEPNLSISGVSQNAFIAPINADGLYKILAVTFEGDNRGNPWYCNIVCNDVNQPASFGSVQGKWL